KSVYKTICGLLCCCVLASLAFVSEVKADGTEQLGLPSIPIAPGSYLLVEGTGLKDAPGDITVAIPADDTIVQVLLY
ncbi:MAG: hypothetical protein KAH23_09395, partial [Kiritimatiellae bacterium]|nr:hypothetical protein [Kiritimatiellia bacterium]